MPHIDAITAFGRLLRDGPLRDAYAARPAQTIRDLNVADSEQATLLNLDPKDLEAQAQVLLRKRFETVSRLMPQTCAKLGPEGWPLFVEYARRSWPSDQSAAFVDADQFCRHLAAKLQFAAAPADTHRIAFGLSGSRLAIHVTSALFIRHRSRAGIQVFVRRSASRWSEYVIYCAFG